MSSCWPLICPPPYLPLPKSQCQSLGGTCDGECTAPNGEVWCCCGPAPTTSPTPTYSPTPTPTKAPTIPTWAWVAIAIAAGAAIGIAIAYMTTQGK